MTKYLRSPNFVAAVLIVATVFGFLGYQQWVVWPRQQRALEMAFLYGRLEWSPSEQPKWLRYMPTWLPEGILPCREDYWVEFGDWIVDEERIATVADLPDLYCVQLKSPHITDRTLERLSRFSGIKQLRIWGCNVTDAGLQSLGRSHLYSLALVGTRATHVGLFHFDLRNTFSLTVDLRMLCSSTPGERKKLSSLTSLTLMDDATPANERRWDFLDDCPLLKDLKVYAALDEQAAERITRLPRLRELAAKIVDDRHFELVGTSPSLKSLQLFGNITGSGFRGFASSCAEELEIHSDVLEASMLGELQNLPELSHLVIVSSKVTRAGILPLSQCPGIVHLELEGAQIGEEDLEAFRQFPKLRILTLRATNVTYEAALRNVKKFPFELDWWPRPKEPDQRMR